MNKAMKVFMAAAFAVVTAGVAMAGTTTICAYTMTDSTSGNAVEGYHVAHGATSATHFGPFNTNGVGSGGGFYAGGKTAARANGHNLYVSDGGSDNITHFTFTAKDCTALTLDTTHYPSGDTSVVYGDQLAISPDGKFMFVGATGNFSLYSIAIAANGSLGAPVFQQSTSDYPDGFEVSADGKSLVVGYPDIESVCAYGISGGTLSAPSCQTPAGLPTGIAIDSASKCAYSGDISLSNGLTEVTAFPLTPGTLGAGTDYSSFGTAADSQAVLVSSNQKVIYISSVSGASVTTGSLAAGCVLSNPTTLGIPNFVVNSDQTGQLAQGKTASGYMVTGDFNTSLLPQMGLFKANGSTGALSASTAGALPLTSGGAPISVVVVGQKN
jgi:hypothetical protein